MKKPPKAKPKRRRGRKELPAVRTRAERGSRFELTGAPRGHRGRSGAGLAALYTADERLDLALLLMPFFIVAFAVATSQALRPALRNGGSIADRGHFRQAALEASRPALPKIVPLGEMRAPPPLLRAVNRPPDVARANRLALAVAPARPPKPAVGDATPPLEHPTRVEPAVSRPVSAGAVVSPLRQAALLEPLGPTSLVPLASPHVPQAVPGNEIPGASRLLWPTPEVTARDAEMNVCLASSRDGPSPGPEPTEPVHDSQSFGLKLARAARAQTTDFVIYNDRYRRISFPMGDISPLFGVCTDVVVRAYRELGIDLQALVHQQRVGSGDANIDHRRTETLRRFFSAYGEKLPISQFHEDYRPGDIVTYYRPQNRRSRSHIAIVADVTGPSGRPMIVHNRGWGPQLEDALFVDAITGHYRFSGAKSPEKALSGLAFVTARRPGRSGKSATEMSH